MLYLATDHRGLKLKNQLKAWLIDKKIKFKDLGCYDYNQEDSYVNYAKKACEKVLENKENKAIIFCGSGAGISIAANKLNDIRCGLGFNHRQIKSFVEHDDVNILAIASDYTKKFKCFQLAKTFLKSKFKGEARHKARLKSIGELEK